MREAALALVTLLAVGGCGTDPYYPPYRPIETEADLRTYGNSIVICADQQPQQAYKLLLEKMTECYPEQVDKPFRVARVDPSKTSLSNAHLITMNHINHRETSPGQYTIVHHHTWGGYTVFDEAVDLLPGDAGCGSTLHVYYRPENPSTVESIERFHENYLRRHEAWLNGEYVECLY